VKRRVAFALRLYPRRFRERYGEELAALAAEEAGVRDLADLALGGVRERLREDGLAAVICAWALFVVAGCNVQKLAEHWQDAVPPGSRAVPAAAFDALVAAAAAGSALVLAGAALALPAALRLVRAGGRPYVRRPLLAAAACTAGAAAATAALAAGRQSFGVALAWLVLVLASLVAWTVAGVAFAARIELSPRTRRLEARLATGVAGAMTLMTLATAVWWAGVGSFAAAPALAASLLAMLASTALTAAAARSVS